MTCPGLVENPSVVFLFLFLLLFVLEGEGEVQDFFGKSSCMTLLCLFL